MTDEVPYWNEKQYQHNHYWIRSNYGKADHCSNDISHKGPFHWANISGLHLQNISDYMQLCVKCHSRLDNKKVTHCPRGHLYDDKNTYITPLDKRMCRICAKEATRRYKEKKYAAVV